VASYASHLRVYEPLASFPEPERRRWERYLAEGSAPSRAGGVELEHRAALVAAMTVPSRVDVDHAFVHRSGGQTYLCPWRTRLRTFEAMAEFRASLPVELADAFVPRRFADEAERELAAIRAAEPGVKTYIQTSTWQVPLRWFVPFEGEERRLVLDGERSLSYVTTMSNARRRVARTLAVLRRTLDDEDGVVDGVEEIGRWLEEYHPRSVVELDYGGLVHLFDDDELWSDESAADIAHAVQCLAAGDTDEASETYRRVTERWGAVRAVEVAN
jgi:hypothetical protein